MMSKLPLSAIILEDEAIAARRLKRMIHEVCGEEIVVIETFQAISDLAEYLLEHTHPDILFQDIMVADGNSFDLYDIVEVRSKVIFITAYDEFAIQALRKNAVDYLLKPLKAEELSNALSRIRQQDTSSLRALQKEFTTYKERFLIRFGNKLHSVNTIDIAYIYSEEKLSFFILRDGKRVPSDLSLQDIQDELNPEQFFRANRQFIIHIDSISQILRYSRARLNLKLEPPYPQDIIISTENTPRFKEWMDR
jgi:DNA-binding LytR/AlgR family response regulator